MKNEGTDSAMMVKVEDGMAQRVSVDAACDAMEGLHSRALHVDVE